MENTTPFSAQALVDLRDQYSVLNLEHRRAIDLLNIALCMMSKDHADLLKRSALAQGIRLENDND